MRFLFRSKESICSYFTCGRWMLHVFKFLFSWICRQRGISGRIPQLSPPWGVNAIYEYPSVMAIAPARKRGNWGSCPDFLWEIDCWNNVQYFPSWQVCIGKEISLGKMNGFHPQNRLIVWGCFLMNLQQNSSRLLLLEFLITDCFYVCQSCLSGWSHPNYCVRANTFR